MRLQNSALVEGILESLGGCQYHLSPKITMKKHQGPLWTKQDTSNTACGVHQLPK